MTFLRSTLWLPPVLALALAASAGGGAEGGAQTGDGSVVTLEPVFVEASSANPWQYFKVPGYEVISHCPDDFNGKFARALDRAAAAREALLPEDFWGKLATPVKIILYNRKPEGRPGLARARPIDLSWEADEDGAAGPYSVVKSYPAVVGDGDTFINCGNYWDLIPGAPNFSVDPDSAILLESRAPQWPAWLRAGLEGPQGLVTNRVIESAASGPDFLVLPSVVWVSAAETAAILKDPRHPRAVLPLPELFKSPVTADLAAWEAGTALFVRWGLFGREPDGAPHREAFLGFVRSAASEPVSEEVFRRSFGMGYAEAEGRLRAFVATAVGPPVRVPLRAASERPLELREATPSEIARIVGEWGRLEGKAVGMQDMGYQSECLEQADRLFERAYARTTDDPQFLAAYGLYALQVGDMKRARECLGEATDRGVVRPRAYVELARVRLLDALPYAEQGIGDLSDPDYAAILRLLATAREQMPSLLAGYQVLARAMEHAPRRPTREDMAVLLGAVGLFPRNGSFAYKVATLYRRFGYPEDARAVVLRAMGLAETKEARARLASVLDGGR